MPYTIKQAEMYKYQHPIGSRKCLSNFPSAKNKKFLIIVEAPIQMAAPFYFLNGRQTVFEHV